MSTRVELFIWSCWVNAAFSFAMVALVLFSKPWTKVKLIWSVACLSVGAWCISLGAMSTTQDYHTALTGTLFVTGTSLWIPVFILHLVHSLLGRTEKRSLILAYTFTFLLSILNATGQLNDVRPIADFYYYTVAKPAYFLFPVQLYSLFILAGVWLWKASRTAPPVKKKQLLFLLAGVGLGLLGGQTTYPMVFDIPIFPWGVIFVPVYVVLVAYSMMKYQFMDFRLAAKKLSLTLTIYICLGILSAPIFVPSIQKILSHSPDLRYPLVVLALRYTVVIALGGFIYTLLVQRSFWLKSHMTMGLTHELKSPLANIRGAVDYLYSQFQSQVNPAEKPNEYLEMIRRNTIRLEAYVNDLLNIASIQDDTIVLDRKPFSLMDTVRAVCEIYEPLIKAKGLLLEVRKGEGDFVLNADEAKIRQVISNLLSNALKFSEEGKISIELTQTDKEIQCSVSDEGPGIPKELRERVFERFFQAEPGSKGSGLGLAIAKAWVEAHGGRIWILNNRFIASISGGSKLIFTLPE